MELSRVKVLYGGLILQLLFTIAVPLPYTKYGRQCSDIGCLSTQVCVMAYDSCNLGQREGNECGRYPTCKKNTEVGLSAGPSDNSNDLYSNKPAPPKTAPPSSDDDVLTSLGLNPGAPNANRPAASRPNSPAPSAPGYNPYANPYPVLPPSQPQPAPAPTPYRPAGGSGTNYYGGGGGGGGGAVPHSGGNRGQFDGSGGNVVLPTQKPSSGGGGFFSGILSDVQNTFSNAFKKQIGTYIGQQLGFGPGGASQLGSLFDSRNTADTRRFGGLFSEKKPSTAPSATTSGGAFGPYPVTVEQRGQVYGANAPQGNRGTASAERQSSRPSQNAAGTPPTYGWKLD